VTRCLCEKKTMAAFLLFAFGVSFAACVSTCSVLFTGCTKDADAFGALATIAIYELTGLLALVFAVAAVERTLLAAMNMYLARRKWDAIVQLAAIGRMSSENGREKHGTECNSFPDNKDFNESEKPCTPLSQASTA